MAKDQNKGAVYVVGDGDRERQRLKDQAALLDPFTRRLFVEAGIGPGMRVLDVGSGMGDVALMAAELVGPTGSVVGVDTNPDVLVAARGRAPENVRFVEGDIRQLELDGEFDAVVGRLVLMYLQDPAEALVRVTRNLRSGGVAAFLEPELALEGRSVPQIPVQEESWKWMVETLRQAGVEMHMGMKLRPSMHKAGLIEPQLQASTLIGAGPGWAGYRYGAETIRSMLPLMESLGVVTAAEVDIDTLAARLEAEALRLDSTLMLSTWIGCWARKV